MRFDELPLCDEVLDGLDAMNFTEMTPVQEHAIPVILEKKDLIACAQTGTGKTAAFLLPLINNLYTEPRAENAVNAIIMSPTRELVQQTDQQMEGFSYFVPVSSVAVYGGGEAADWDIQRNGLQKGADVIIATPGRLISHLNLSEIDLSKVKYFILDEADRMLDMGFFDDIMMIVNRLPKERQTLMFSATMPPKIRQLAKTILNDPVEVKIAISRPPETIMQTAYICEEGQKLGIIKHLFSEKTPNKVILFSGAKIKVKELTRTLRKMGLSVAEMHSDLEQNERDAVMHEFKNNRVNMLIATDIVSRGIDIDDVTLIINFEVPYEVEDYVHRIGRTARAGDEGMSITLVAPDEQYRFKKIEEFLGKEIYKIPVPAELGEAPEYNPKAHKKRGRKLGKRKRSRKKGSKKYFKKEKNFHSK
ncbi:MAG: DEAD/DEAH box helicase [Bacteroidales bacterium]|nr:DEAD/DEAH box helicase [Bacteroidales bacterium]